MRRFFSLFIFQCRMLQVSQWYDLVVFTASMEIYGAAVADKLDNSRGILNKRYYRQVRKTVNTRQAFFN